MRNFVIGGGFLIGMTFIASFMEWGKYTGEIPLEGMEGMTMTVPLSGRNGSVELGSVGLPNWAPVVATLFAGIGVVFRATHVWITPKYLLYAAAWLVYFHQIIGWVALGSGEDSAVGPGLAVMGILGTAVLGITFKLPRAPSRAGDAHAPPVAAAGADDG